MLQIINSTEPGGNGNNYYSLSSFIFIKPFPVPKLLDLIKKKKRDNNFPLSVVVDSA